MRTMNFDAIATAVPLNRQASTVRDGSGDQWKPRNPDGRAHFDAPELQRGAQHSDKGRAMIAQLVGYRFGRFVVMGLAEKQNPKKPATWLCRCACGQYEHRKAKAIRGPHAHADACYQCKALMKLQAGQPSTRKEDAARLDALAERERSQ